MPGRLAHSTGGGTSVARYTAGRNPGMVILATTDEEPRDPHFMAAITGQRRGDVGSRLPWSLNSVVAGLPHVPGATPMCLKDTLVQQRSDDSYHRTSLLEYASRVFLEPCCCYGTSHNFPEQHHCA